MAELELDTDKLDNAALAILSLTLHEGNRVWKGFDWAITDRLHAEGVDCGSSRKDEVFGFDG